VDEKIVSETIPNVLYPNDEPEGGKQLRLVQQYFFASCSLQDIIRLLAPDARQSLLAEALERWPLPLFGASSRSPMRSTFRGTGKLSDPHSQFDVQVKRLHDTGEAPARAQAPTPERFEAGHCLQQAQAFLRRRGNPRNRHLRRQGGPSDTARPS
jgi:Carbohydrate phosphorylase